MAHKQFTQEELNRIVAARLKRERDRLAREFEVKLKRCMAAVHLTLYQEMCSLKWELDAEAIDAAQPESTEKSPGRQSNFQQSEPAKKTT